MTIKKLTAADQAQYNDFTAGHASGSFLQSWDWGSWQEADGKSVARYFVHGDNGEILLAAQVINTPIPRLSKSYLYIPYGPLLKPGLDETELKTVSSFFLDELRKTSVEALFIRIEPKQVLPAPDQTSGGIAAPRPTKRIQPGKTLILALSQTETGILEQMHPKTRYNIKVARRHNVQIVSQPVVIPGHGLHLKEVVDLLTQTADRQHYKSHGASYYRRLIDFFGRAPAGQTRLTIYKALLGQELLACGLMVDFGNARTYLFGGTSPAQRNVMAPYLMHWQAILDAQTSGLKYYDFWGIETAKGATPGFVRFKLGWGGEQANYPAPLDLVVKPLWYNAYRLLRSINRKF